MQTVPVQNILGMLLRHDVTRIVSGKSKGRISEKTKGGMIFTITDLQLSVE
ncbi:MAG: hypothetical protein SWH54_07190 [Thermodesulfobacteriota bacterium]|nr:hypothetical protein [Thermodesulfobacteriota bacterium]